jgi:hypothetical protein
VERRPGKSHANHLKQGQKQKKPAPETGAGEKEEFFFPLAAA